MFDIYERRIKDDFAGEGTESLVVKDNIIVAHVRGWDNPHVVDKNWKGPLVGKKAGKRGDGWRKLRGSALENAQAWAKDIA